MIDCFLQIRLDQTGVACPIRLGHLNWFDHISSASTLMAAPHIWAPWHLFSWLYSINDTSFTRAHTPTFTRTGFLVVTWRELGGRLKEKWFLSWQSVFHLTVCVLIFLIQLHFGILISLHDPLLDVMTLNNGTSPKWFVSSVKQKRCSVRRSPATVFFV